MCIWEWLLFLSGPYCFTSFHTRLQLVLRFYFSSQKYCSLFDLVILSLCLPGKISPILQSNCPSYLNLHLSCSTLWPQMIISVHNLCPYQTWRIISWKYNGWHFFLTVHIPSPVPVFSIWYFKFIYI